MPVGHAVWAGLAQRYLSAQSACESARTAQSDPANNILLAVVLLLGSTLAGRGGREQSLRGLA